jgi:hypothetical protein
MAGHDHPLIDAYLTIMTRQLPANAVEELADGLTETYRHHLSRGLDPDTAAAAAIAEFGEPDLVLAAFIRQSPGQRAARALLCSGPAVGFCWGATLITGHAWTWPVPAALRLAFGLTLLAAITTLAFAATSRHSYRRTRMTAAGGVGLITLDATMLATVLLIPQPLVWPMALAIPASLTRIALTARVMPRLLTR